MSRFVEFTEATAKNTPLFLRPEDVATVAVCGGETIISCSEKRYYYVSDTPAEVVAKLQQPESAAPPAESEAVQLLERLDEYVNTGTRKTWAKLITDTRALLAKLKGGKP